MGGVSEAPALAVIFLAWLGFVPAAMLGGAAAVTRQLTRHTSGSIGRTAVTYAFALVPVGLGVWLAHYGFHLLTGVLTVIPTAQSAAIDVFGWAAFGGPNWRLAGMTAGSVFPIQLGFVLLGTAGSLALAYRISQQEYPERPGLPTAPWAIVTVSLASLAVWIFSQPMEMRGVGFIG
jgi:hypothetical protein